MVSFLFFLRLTITRNKHCASFHRVEYFSQSLFLDFMKNSFTFILLLLLADDGRKWFDKQICSLGFGVRLFFCFCFFCCGSYTESHLLLWLWFSLMTCRLNETFLFSSLVVDGFSVWKLDWSEAREAEWGLALLPELCRTYTHHQHRSTSFSFRLSYKTPNKKKYKKIQ